MSLLLPCFPFSFICKPPCCSSPIVLLHTQAKTHQPSSISTKANCRETAWLSKIDLLCVNRSKTADDVIPTNKSIWDLLKHRAKVVDTARRVDGEGTKLFTRCYLITGLLRCEGAPLLRQWYKGEHPQGVKMSTWRIVTGFNTTFSTCHQRVWVVHSCCVYTLFFIRLFVWFKKKKFIHGLFRKLVTRWPCAVDRTLKYNY